jgi:hypothetical protein
MYISAISRYRAGRVARLFFRNPVRRHEFPAKAERLITADELLRYGV